MEFAIEKRRHFLYSLFSSSRNICSDWRKHMLKWAHMLKWDINKVALHIFWKRFYKNAFGGLLLTKFVIVLQTFYHANSQNIAEVIITDSTIYIVKYFWNNAWERKILSNDFKIRCSTIFNYILELQSKMRWEFVYVIRFQVSVTKRGLSKAKMFIVIIFVETWVVM